MQQPVYPAQPQDKKPFNRTWYLIFFLGPPGAFVALLLLAFKEPAAGPRLVGRVVLAVLVLLWIADMIVLLTTGKL
jgi:hypothetical protein